MTSRKRHARKRLSVPSSTTPAVAVDVILRDGSTLRLRAPASRRRGRPHRVLRGALGAQPLPALPRRAPRRCGARRALPRSRPWSTAARSSASSPTTPARRRSSRSPSSRGCATRPSRRSRSPSPTSSRDAAPRHALLEQLAARAAEAGIESFVAEVLPENAPMLCGLPRRRLRGVAHARAAARSRCASRSRRPRSSAHASRSATTSPSPRRCEPFFAPATVAVIGASKRRGSIGGELFRNILAADFAGAAYPVNPAGEAVAGVRAYRAIEEIPDPVDLAVICVPGGRVLEAAEAALRKGVPALCVISAGFAEVGAEGAERQAAAARARARARRAARRPELPRHRRPRARAERDVRAARAARPAASRSRRRAARSGSRCSRRRRSAGSASRPSSRSATRPTSRRTTCSSGGRRTTETDVVLLYLESFGNPQQVRARRAPRRAAQADPRAEGRDVERRRARRELAHGGARRLGRRGRRAVPAAPACCARATSRSSSTSRRCSRASRSRRAAASPC